MAEKKDDSALFDAADLLGAGQDKADVDGVNPDPVAACLEDGLRPAKVKAGYYLPAWLLERLDETYLTLRLKKEPVESKSQLVELALGLLLADLEAGEESSVLRCLREG